MRKNTFWKEAVIGFILLAPPIIYFLIFYIINGELY